MNTMSICQNAFSVNVAINAQGAVVGFNFAGVTIRSMKPHQYFVNVVVDPAHRQQGIGAQLWMTWSVICGRKGRMLLAEVNEGDPIHYRFAENVTTPLIATSYP